MNFSYSPKHLQLLVLCFTAFAGIGHAQVQSPVDIALRHIEQNQKSLNLSIEDVNDFLVKDVYGTKHNGVTHVYLAQRHAGIEVFNGILNVNILPNGEVLNMGNRFIADLAARVNTTQPDINATEAVQAVIKHFDLKVDGNSLKIQKTVSNQHFIFDPSGIALEPVPVKLAYQPMENKDIRLVWNVRLYELGAQHWWNARVDAITGKVIAHHDQVIHCNFGDADEECSANHKHHTHKAATPQKQAKGKKQQAKGSSMPNSYNVYPMPIESPNHGNQQTVTDPANLTASPYGWHDTNGADGAEYTITRGNNTHAYHDIFNLDNSIDDEPDGGSTLEFNTTHDENNSFPFTQVESAVINLFYWNNVMHDLWYMHGFDEAAGNFQVNNYGNGGIANDPVRAEGLDGAGTNNANFGTDSDGSGARMQMFIWGSSGTASDNATLIATAPAEVQGEFPVVHGGFGGDITVTGISGLVALALDEEYTNTVCTPIINGYEIENNIAMIDRGDCEFGFKSLEAEAKGATAVIMCNNVPGDGAIIMGAGEVGDQVTIPVMMLSYEDCLDLKFGLPYLTITVEPVDLTIPDPGPEAIDGDFDNGIIAHEYGHGISIRMTGGPSTGSCLSSEEQQGEGWSDWFGLVMQTTVDMNANQPRGIGTYANGQPTTGGGIRTYPYTRNMGINPHTYADITTEAVPHGVGSVWCAMIWDMYWNLIDEYGFDEDFYNGTGGNNMAMKLVVDGIKMQPCNPSFPEARDAIIAADVANNGGANVCMLWETFARRGLGASATGGGGEAFDLSDQCSMTLKMNKNMTAYSLEDGTIDYEVVVTNDLPTPLGGLVVLDQLPAGTTLQGGTTSCDGAVDASGLLTINVDVLLTGQSRTCTYTVIVPEDLYSPYVFTDDMEGGAASWNTSEGPTNTTGTSWTLGTDNPHSGANAWFIPDIETQVDAFLETTTIIVEGIAPVLSFWHEYDTEVTWDGGVVEMNANGSGNWEDAGTMMIKNGYNTTITENEDSSISNRPAFSGRSGKYIETRIDLSSLVGSSVQFRFRMACDGAVGAGGWYIDDVTLYTEVHDIENSACVMDGGGENEVCKATSVIFLGDDVSGIEETTLVENAFSLYPNPAKDELMLVINNADFKGEAVSIFSADGRLMSTATITGNSSMELNIADLTAGIYMVQVKSANGLSIKKLVVSE